MINDSCLEALNWRGKENMLPASRTRLIIVVVELLFLLLWSSDYIGFKICLSLSGTFSLLFVGAHVSLQFGWHWPDQRGLLIVTCLLAERDHLYQ